MITFNYLIKFLTHHWMKGRDLRTHACIEGIDTDVFNRILAQYMSDGWLKTYEYDGFDAWIDYGSVILEKDGEEIYFEWDNWMEGEVSGSKSEIERISSGYKIS